MAGTPVQLQAPLSALTSLEEVIGPYRPEGLASLEERAKRRGGASSNHGASSASHRVVEAGVSRKAAREVVQELGRGRRGAFETQQERVGPVSDSRFSTKQPVTSARWTNPNSAPISDGLCSSDEGSSSIDTEEDSEGESESDTDTWWCCCRSRRRRKSKSRLLQSQPRQYGASDNNPEMCFAGTVSDDNVQLLEADAADCGSFGDEQSSELQSIEDDDPFATLARSRHANQTDAAGS